MEQTANKPYPFKRIEGGEYIELEGGRAQKSTRVYLGDFGPCAEHAFKDGYRIQQNPGVGLIRARDENGSEVHGHLMFSPDSNKKDTFFFRLPA